MTNTTLERYPEGDVWPEWAVKGDQSRVERMRDYVVLSRAGDRLHVSAPECPAFEAKAVELGGRWRARTFVWSFSIFKYSSVIIYCNQYFGSYFSKTTPDGKFRKFHKIAKKIG